jgi:hypothetical protein
LKLYFPNKARSVDQLTFQKGDLMEVVMEKPVGAWCDPPPSGEQEELSPPKQTSVQDTPTTPSSPTTAKANNKS